MEIKNQNQSQNENENSVCSCITSLFSDEKIIRSTLQSIVNCMFSGVIIAKTNGEFTVWSETAKNIIGFEPENIPVDKWSEHYGCYYGDSPDKLMETKDLPLVRAMNGESLFGLKIFVLNKNQPGIWINCNASPLKNRGKIIGGVLVFQDVTMGHMYSEVNDRLHKMVSSIDELNKKYLNVGNKK